MILDRIFTKSYSVQFSLYTPRWSVQYLLVYKSFLALKIGIKNMGLVIQWRYRILCPFFSIPWILSFNFQDLPHAHSFCNFKNFIEHNTNTCITFTWFLAHYCLSVVEAHWSFVYTDLTFLPESLSELRCWVSCVFNVSFYNNIKQQYF